jgi:hypothetical protein
VGQLAGEGRYALSPLYFLPSPLYSLRESGQGARAAVTRLCRQIEAAIPLPKVTTTTRMIQRKDETTNNPNDSNNERKKGQKDTGTEK